MPRFLANLSLYMLMNVMFIKKECIRIWIWSLHRQENKMAVNPGKFQAIIILDKRKSDHRLTKRITIDKGQMKVVSTVKRIGFTIKINFNLHISNISKCCFLFYFVASSLFCFKFVLLLWVFTFTLLWVQLFEIFSNKAV